MEPKKKTFDPFQSLASKDEDDVDEMVEEEIEDDDFPGPSDYGGDDGSMQLTEEKLREIDPLAIIEYENQEKRIDKRKDPIGALEEQFKVLYIQQESTAIAHHTLMLRIREMGNELKGILAQKKELNNTIRKLEEFRKAEDLSDVDFEEIVQRVINVIKDKGVGNAPPTPKETKKSLFSLNSLIPLVALCIAILALFLSFKNINHENSNSKIISSVEDQLRTSILIKDGTKVFCNGAKEAIKSKEGTIYGILKGDVFYFDLRNGTNCYFKIEK